MTKHMKGDSGQVSSSTSADGNKQNKRRPRQEQEGGIAASLAHEINNPLEALRNLLHLLEGEIAFTKNGRRYLALAQEEALRISEISHAAMNRLRGIPGPENTNLPELLRSVLDFYGSRFKLQGISVSTSFCSNGTLSVYPQQLRQMFSNLLLNAADAMPDGGAIQARISVGHEWGQRQRHGVRLTIADNGCGITRKDLPRILNPFFTTKGSAGTGIGLSIVRDTVRMHRGVLRVRSNTKPGRSGTVFTVFLPKDDLAYLRQSA